MLAEAYFWMRIASMKRDLREKGMEKEECAMEGVVVDIRYEIKVEERLGGER